MPLCGTQPPARQPGSAGARLALVQFMAQGVRDPGSVAQRVAAAGPESWLDYVNAAETASTLAALRRSVARGAPYGNPV